MTNYKTLKLKELLLLQKTTEEKINELKEELKQELEDHNSKFFADKNIKVTYVDSTVRSSVDTQRLKEQYNEVYKICSVQKPVKSSIRVEVLQ